MEIGVLSAKNSHRALLFFHLNSNFDDSNENIVHLNGNHGDLNACIVHSNENSVHLNEA